MSEEIIRALGLWLHGGACKWGVSLHRIAYARYHTSCLIFIKYSSDKNAGIFIHKRTRAWITSSNFRPCGLHRGTSGAANDREHSTFFNQTSYVKEIRYQSSECIPTSERLNVSPLLLISLSHLDSYTCQERIRC